MKTPRNLLEKEERRFITMILERFNDRSQQHACKSLQCSMGLGNQWVGLRKTTEFGRNRKVLNNEE